MTNPAPTYELVPLDRLHPHPDNPRLADERVIAALMRSMDAFGCVEPLVVRRSDHRIIGGHKRWEAARRLELREAPVVWWEGDDRAAKTLLLALNQIDGSWDRPALGQILAELADVDNVHEALLGFDPTATELAGFDTGAVLALLDSALGTPTPREDLTALLDGPAPTSDAEPLAPGEGFQLGAHRVVCGDARDGPLLAAALAGARPTVCFTDPPYNVAYDPDGAATAGSGRPRSRRRRLGAIANDNLSDDAYAALITEALQQMVACSAPGAAVYCCGGFSTTAVYDAAFVGAGIRKRAILIWDKGHFTLGRRDYQSQVEFLHYGWTPGTHRFFGGRGASDLWTIPRDPAQQYLHPTQKPVALAERAIRNSSQAGETVLDPFGGSGSTLIAAEQAGRRAVLIEQDPHYVAVIVRRWEALTGQRAEPLAKETPDA